MLIEIPLIIKVLDFWIQPRPESDHNPCCCSLFLRNQAFLPLSVHNFGEEVHLNHKSIKVKRNCEEMMTVCIEQKKVQPLMSQFLETDLSAESLVLYDSLISQIFLTCAKSKDKKFKQGIGKKAWYDQDCVDLKKKVSPAVAAWYKYKEDVE